MVIGYIAGESMGWGDWIGQQCGSALRCGDEGEKNGIKYLASKFAPCGTDAYNKIALVIRGFYWWFLALLPLVCVVNPLLVAVAIVLLACGFQLSVSLAKGTGSLKWENAETLYGGMQDLVLLSLILASV